MWEWLNKNGSGITALVAVFTILATGAAYFVGMNARFDVVDAHFASMNTRFDGLNVRLDDFRGHIDKRFDGIDRRIDRTSSYLDALREDVVRIGQRVSHNEASIASMERLMEYREGAP